MRLLASTVGAWGMRVRIFFREKLLVTPVAETTFENMVANAHRNRSFRLFFELPPSFTEQGVP